MIDLLIFFALVSIFGGKGVIFFFIYILLKTYLPALKQAWENKNYKNIIDLDKIKTGYTSAKSKIKESKVNNFNSSSFNFSNMTFPKLKAILGLVLTLVIFLLILDGFTSIPAGHVGVVYDRGRGVLETPFQEGLHLKIPFWQVVTKMDTRLQAYTMSIAPGEGSNYGDDSIESLTKDGQKVFVDITIQYRISGDNAPWIYQNVGLDFAEKVIRPGVRNVVRDVTTGYDSTNLFTQETRTKAQLAMEEALKVLYEKNKITLDNLLLRNIQFSENYLQAIEDKQVAQQRIQKAEYERQEAEIVKEKKIIEAQAEAESIRLKGETLKANPQVIQFEFVQKMADDINWGVLPDGVLPLLNLGGQQ